MSDILKVDLQDNIIGYGTKEECHKTPILHRAFSVFLYSGNKMLIQQRAMHKYHSGGLWTNACCSHPKKDEDFFEAVQNRLEEELGITCAVEEKFEFVYYHRFEEDLYEYEIDHVFVGEFRGDVTLNPDEAMDSKWIGFEELKNDVLSHPEKYTVWFITALPKVLEIINVN
ncbi:MAG: isopentenyl-diphosphate Delta-isomerase [Clostridia bacterium]|nr:isopentenyl-diphosphate Delta-isomerase [Clostridia bacterium]